MAKGAIIALVFLAAVSSASLRAAENGGLGPLSIRNQFPVGLAFLNYTPESPVTLPASTFQVRYQFSATNSFVNTQSPTNQAGPFIDRTAVSRPGGLVASDFSTVGYGLYLDVETKQHRFFFNYALGDSLEVGLELAWISLGGGSLDSRIDSVEDFFGGVNEDRAFSDQDRFDYYLIRNGVFLRNSSQSFTNEPMDPVLNLKWTLSEGGDVLPALAVKLSYKAPLESNPVGARQLISSGGSDWGYYVLFGKQIGRVVAHLQFGTTRLNVVPDQFAERLKHKMFGLEFRISPEYSFIVQSVSQSSIFKTGNVLTNLDFSLGTQTDVGTLGFKHRGENFLSEFGFVEDYNQQLNEADITFYLEMGAAW